MTQTILDARVNFDVTHTIVSRYPLIGHRGHDYDIRIITFVWKERTVDERFKTNFANDFRNGLDELLSRSRLPKHGQKFRDITLMDSRFDPYHF